MRDFTALGGVGVVVFLTCTVAGFLWLEGKTRSLQLLLAAIAGAWVASSLLKAGFDRPRPDRVPHGSYVYTSSFPSGHSLMAAATYRTIGAMLARLYSGWATKAYILTLAVILTAAVGVSRIYLGVHWPTDVLAGWTLGGCWALGCSTLTRRLQKQGALDPPTPT